MEGTIFIEECNELDIAKRLKRAVSCLTERFLCTKQISYAEIVTTIIIL